jgi:ankyrin repeat protein
MIANNVSWVPSITTTQSYWNQNMDHANTNCLSSSASLLQSCPPAFGTQEFPNITTEFDRSSTGNASAQASDRQASLARLSVSPSYQPSRDERNSSQDLRTLQNHTPHSPRITGNDSGISLRHRQNSLIHLAIASGNADTLRLLLQNLEITTDERDASGYTALELAILNGQTDLVAILLDHGFDGASNEVTSGLG